MKIKTAALLTATVLATLVPAAHSATVIGDTFQLNGTDREVGDPLNGTTTEIGGATWTAVPQFVFAGDNTDGYVGVTGTIDGHISVPFSFATYSGLGSIATLKVESNVAAWSMWSGFARNIDSLTINGKLWAMVVPVSGTSTNWAVYTGATELYSGTASTAGPFSFSLSYDESADLIVDFSLNGTSLLSNTTFTPVFADATSQSVLFFQNAVVGNSLNSVDIAVVPEPSAYALLFLGVGVICLFRVRRARA